MKPTLQDLYDPHFLAENIHTPTAYISCQNLFIKLTDLKPQDIVTITRKTSSHMFQWRNGWDEGMDKYVEQLCKVGGYPQTGKVIRKTSTGSSGLPILLVEEKYMYEADSYQYGRYMFPFFVVKKL